MLRIVLTGAAMMISGPALAQSQLEILLGVNPGRYSAAQLTEMHFAKAGGETPPVQLHTRGALVFSSHGLKTEPAQLVPTGARLPAATRH